MATCTRQLKTPAILIWREAKGLGDSYFLFAPLFFFFSVPYASSVALIALHKEIKVAESELIIFPADKQTFRSVEIYLLEATLTAQ